MSEVKSRVMDETGLSQLQAQIQTKAITSLGVSEKTVQVFGVVSGVASSRRKGSSKRRNRRRNKKTSSSSSKKKRDRGSGNGNGDNSNQGNTGDSSKPRLPDDANVVRGGKNLPENIKKGTSTHPEGITGVSVESAPGKSIADLSSSETVPHGQIGTTTVGDVRRAGGDVIPTKGVSPHHATLTGLSPEKVSELLTPTIPNPTKKR